MFKLSNYSIGVDICAVALFLTIMTPNLIWFVFPAPNDCLRAESITGLIDGIASISQMIMIAALCVVINGKARCPMKRKFVFCILLFIALYYVGWILYYHGVTLNIIIFDLCASPCIAFILFSIARKNGLALLSAIVFLSTHLIYGIVNFMI